MIYRSLEPIIQEDLPARMVFIGGPRQVGKTTLIADLNRFYHPNVYLNWDQPKHKTRILNQEWPPETDYLVLDEIHKYPKWKSLLKGIWDTRGTKIKIAVTGSSRLNVFRRGGDSLMGRYHYFTLHPFSVAELEKKPLPVFTETPPEWHFERSLYAKSLWELNGFPEPFASGSRRTLRRWQRERFDRIFRDDIRSYENIRHLALIEILAQRIPARVGSPFSLQAAAEDLEVSFPAIRNWMEILNRNYYLFRVPPYGGNLTRTFKKEGKIYLWDWAELADPGPRFENFLAVHLLKYCTYFQEAHGISCELWYIRDREKREVDFLLTWEKKPWRLIEAKLNWDGAPGALCYYGEKFKVPDKYVVTQGTQHDFIDRKTGVRVIPAEKFLTALV
jgi:uncharacterized protein